MTKKIISVFGATGSAGGSVAKYLLDDGTFAVRAVTRNVDSPAARALAALGAEVVAADLDKPNTLTAALHGAYGVSGLTDFWSLLPKFGDSKKTQAAEETHGKALVDTAKAAGIKHFVWFSMWHCTPSVPHFESKYQVEEYLKASGVPYTVFLNAFYYENLTKISMLKKLDDGTYSVEIPIPEDTYIPSYSVDQSGGWILEAFQKPELYLGQTIVAVGEHLTPRQYAHLRLPYLADLGVLPLSGSYERLAMDPTHTLIPVKRERATFMALFRSIERSFIELDGFDSRLSDEDKTSIQVMKHRVASARGEASHLLGRHVQIDNDEDNARIRVLNLKSRLDSMDAGARMLAEQYRLNGGGHP